MGRPPRSKTLLLPPAALLVAASVAAQAAAPAALPEVITLAVPGGGGAGTDLFAQRILTRECPGRRLALPPGRAAGDAATVLCGDGPAGSIWVLAGDRFKRLDLASGAELAGLPVPRGPGITALCGAERELVFATADGRLHRAGPGWTLTLAAFARPLDRVIATGLAEDRNAGRLFAAISTAAGRSRLAVLDPRDGARRATYPVPECGCFELPRVSGLAWDPWREHLYVNGGGVTLLCRWQRDEAGRRVLRFREYCVGAGETSAGGLRPGLAIALPAMRCAAATPAGPGAVLVLGAAGAIEAGPDAAAGGLFALSLGAGLELLLPGERSADGSGHRVAGRLPLQADLLGSGLGARWVGLRVAGELGWIPLSGSASGPGTGPGLSRSSRPGTVPCRSPR